MSDAGTGEQRRAEAVLHPDPRAWEQLLPTLAVDGSGEADTQGAPFPDNLRLTHVKLAALRDSVRLFPLTLDETSPSTLESPQSKRDRWELGPAWLIHSQEGCHIEEVREGRPSLILSPTRFLGLIGNNSSKCCEKRSKITRRRFCACSPPRPR